MTTVTLHLVEAGSRPGRERRVSRSSLAQGAPSLEELGRTPKTTAKKTGGLLALVRQIT